MTTQDETATRRAAIERWIAGRTAGPDTELTPVSPGQRGLLFHAGMKGPGNTGSAFCYRLRGPLDAPALGQAFDTLVGRHAALRSRYVERGDEPMMVVDPPAPLGVTAEPMIEDGLPETLRRFVTEPFDLSAQTVFRVRLLRLAADDHVLAFVVHHVAFDGWSLGLLQQELATCYTAELAGEPTQLPELPTSYAAFAREQRARLDGGGFADDLRYWSERLQGAPPMLALPTDRPRPIVQTYHGDFHPVSLPDLLCSRLRELAVAERATLPMTLTACYAAFLARWTRSDDVIVGLPVANRLTPDVWPVIGFFVNLLPLRMRVPAGMTVRELVREVRAGFLGALDHQALPFDRLVHDVRGSGQREWSTPLVNVGLALQTAGRGGLVLDGVSAEPLLVHERSSLADMTLTIAPEDGGYEGYLEYNRDLFEPATAQTMMTALVGMVDSAGRHPDAAVSELTLGATPVPVVATVPPAPSFLDKFLAVAPDRPAIGALRYGELAARAARLAGRLRAAGVRPGDAVGVHLPRGEDLVVAFLATLWAGVTYLPLDPALPRRRLETIAGVARAVITAEPVPVASGVPVLHPADDPDALRAERDTTTGAAAYIIFTSGSTGVPKGVVIGRAALDNLVRAQDELPIAGCETFCMVAAPSFDASIWEMVLPLARGGRIDVCDPATLREDLARQRTAVIAATPSLLSLLDEPPPTLRVVVSAGEPLPRELAERLAHRVTVVNSYGPAEATVSATFASSACGDDVLGVGRPMAGVTVHVLDEALRKVPRGAVGEICVGGLGVAIGYLGDPALTARRFVPDPWGPGRLYRTGDLGRIDPDGGLRFLGRLDDQVKINGQRVQLGEVESIARGVPGVRAATAYIGRSAAGIHLGLALCGPAEVEDPVRRRCAELLPPGLCPTRYQFVETMPRTHTGKIDRGALAEATVDGERGPAPGSALERSVSALWATILDTTVDDVERPLYQYGGQSLQATRILAGVARELGVRIPMRDFLARPTVRGLCARIAELRP